MLRDRRSQQRYTRVKHKHRHREIDFLCRFIYWKEKKKKCGTRYIAAADPLDTPTHTGDHRINKSDAANSWPRWLCWCCHINTSRSIGGCWWMTRAVAICKCDPRHKHWRFLCETSAGAPPFDEQTASNEREFPEDKMDSTLVGDRCRKNCRQQLSLIVDAANLWRMQILPVDNCCSCVTPSTPSLYLQIQYSVTKNMTKGFFFF